MKIKTWKDCLAAARKTGLDPQVIGDEFGLHPLLSRLMKAETNAQRWKILNKDPKNATLLEATIKAVYRHNPSLQDWKNIFSSTRSSGWRGAALYALQKHYLEALNAAPDNDERWKIIKGVDIDDENLADLLLGVIIEHNPSRGDLEMVFDDAPESSKARRQAKEALSQIYQPILNHSTQEERWDLLSKISPAHPYYGVVLEAIVKEATSHRERMKAFDCIDTNLPSTRSLAIQEICKHA